MIEEKRNGIRNRDDHQQKPPQKQRETKPQVNGTSDQSRTEQQNLQDQAELVASESTSGAGLDEAESRDLGTAAIKKDEDAPPVSSVDENEVEGGQGEEVGKGSSVPQLVETVGPQQEGERSHREEEGEGKRSSHEKGEGESQLTEQVRKEGLYAMIPFPNPRPK